MIKNLVLKILNGYKTTISPLLRGNSFFLIPAQCRYPITCSEYFILAVKERGVVKGGWMGFERLLHCSFGIKLI